MKCTTGLFPVVPPCALLCEALICVGKVDGALRAAGLGDDNNQQAAGSGRQGHEGRRRRRRKRRKV